MHLGLQWVISAFGPTTVVVKEEIKKEEKRASPFTQDEKILLNKIVEDLFDVLKASSSRTPQDPQRKPYAIIFRQSESWATVESKFLKIDNQDDKIRLWIKKWRKTISDLRGYHKQNQAAGICIYELKRKRLSEGKELDAADLKKIDTWRKDRSETADEIDETLKTAKIELDNNLQDSLLKRNQSAIEVMNFIKENWIHLTVFSEWREVPMDEKKLFVQVRHSNSQKPNLKQWVNLSTKGIFTVEELPAGTQGRSRGIGLQSQCIGPVSPTPSRRSSSVKLMVEDFYDYEYVDQDPIRKMNVPTKSKIGDRLHKIVNCALDEVNDKLAWLDGNENEEPPSDNSVGERNDLTWFGKRNDLTRINDLPRNTDLTRLIDVMFLFDERK